MHLLFGWMIFYGEHFFRFPLLLDIFQLQHAGRTSHHAGFFSGGWPPQQLGRQISTGLFTTWQRSESDQISKLQPCSTKMSGNPTLMVDILIKYNTKTWYTNKLYQHIYTANCLKIGVSSKSILGRGMVPGFPVTYGLWPPCLKGKVRPLDPPAETTCEWSEMCRNQSKIRCVQITAGCRQRQLEAVIFQSWIECLRKLPWIPSDLHAFDCV